MSKTVSTRIPNKVHEKIVECCNRSGCTITEWLSEAINFIFTNSSDFNFGYDEQEDNDTKPEEIKKKRPEEPVPAELHEITVSNV